MFFKGNSIESFSLVKDIFVLILASFILIEGYLITKSHLINLYECYGLAFEYGRSFFLNGHAAYSSCLSTVLPQNKPFHTLPKEYPFLALLPMMFGLINYKYYETNFMILMIIIVGVVYFYLRKEISSSSAYFFALLIVLGGFSLTLSRLDLIAGGLILLILIFARKDKFILSYIILAFATGYKLFPAVLFIPLFFYQNRNHLQKIKYKDLFPPFIFFALSGFFLLLPLIFNYLDAFSPLYYQLNRPIQIESIYSSILYLISLTHLISLCFFNSFGSFNIGIIAHHKCYSGGVLITILEIAGLVFLGAAYILSSRLYLLKRISFEKLILIILSVLILTDKVFSPQYLLWIYPTVAYVIRPRSRYFYFWIIIALLTSIIYPFLYGDTVFNFHIHSANLFLGTILLRNTVLIIFLILYILDFAKFPRYSRFNPKTQVSL